MAAAKRADVGLPFGGVPIGVKELDQVEGWPDTHACVVYRDAIATHTSTNVARARDRGGAVLVGQTTASEFGGVNVTRTVLMHGAGMLLALAYRGDGDEDGRCARGVRRAGLEEPAATHRPAPGVQVIFDVELRQPESRHQRHQAGRDVRRERHRIARDASAPAERHTRAVIDGLGNVALRSGRKIQWDSERERIIGDREANKLVTVEYRKPWKLPYMA